MVFIYMGEINKAIFFLKTFGSVNYFTYLYSVESGGFLMQGQFQGRFVSLKKT